MYTKDMTVAGFDDELWQAMEGERQRQEEHIELIASENMTSLWRRLGQRPAAFRIPGQRRGISCPARTR